MDEYIEAIVELCNSIGEACVFRINEGYIASDPIEQVEDALEEIKKQLMEEDTVDQEDIQEEGKILYLVQPDKVDD